MIEITHNNYLKVGYNNDPFTLRTSSSDQWFIDHTSVSRDPLPFKDECIFTARLLREKTDKTIYLMYSGGIDSEIMLRSFILADIPNWKVFVMNYNNLNEYDLKYSKKFLSENHIEFYEHFFDLEVYWQSEVINDMKKYGCSSPQFPVYSKGLEFIASDLNGFPVIGGGDRYFVKEDDGIFGYEREKGSSLYRSLIINNIHGCIRFFQYTPEQIASWLTSPIFGNVVLNNPDMHVNEFGSSPFKHNFYATNFNDESFLLVPRRKKTGFEYLKERDIQLRQEIKQFSDTVGDQSYRLKYEDICTQLGVQSLLRRP